MARICTLFSGSSGNSVYIGSSDGGILIDAGVSAKRLEKSLREHDIDPYSIKAIFVTHEHNDHISGLRVFASRYKSKVYSSKGTLEALEEMNILNDKYEADEITKEGVCISDIQVNAFRTSHDSRESIGYRIHTGDDRKIAVATDLGFMSDEARSGILGCDLVVIESNHDVRMLQNGKYPYFLKRRILSNTGHLSNDACADNLFDLALKGTTRFILAHLSAENNMPILAHQTALGSLCEKGLCDGKDFLLKVAKRESDEPVMVF